MTASPSEIRGVVKSPFQTTSVSEDPLTNDEIRNGFVAIVREHCAAMLTVHEPTPEFLAGIGAIERSLLAVVDAAMADPPRIDPEDRRRRMLEDLLQRPAAAFDAICQT